MAKLQMLSFEDDFIIARVHQGGIELLRCDSSVCRFKN